MGKSVQEKLDEIKKRQDDRKNRRPPPRLKIDKPIKPGEELKGEPSEGGAAGRARRAHVLGGPKKEGVDEAAGRPIEEIIAENIKVLQKMHPDVIEEKNRDMRRAREAQEGASAAPGSTQTPKPDPGPGSTPPKPVAAQQSAPQPSRLKSWHDDKTPLWSDLRPIEELRSIEKSDPAMFELMYQGNTNHGSASLFPPDQWKLCTPGDYAQESVLLKLLSLDTALTDEEKNDAGGCLEILLLSSGEIIISWAELFRLDFPNLVEYVKNIFIGYRPNYILIEDASSGKSLCQTLTASHPFLPILPRKVKQEGTKSNSKVARAMAVTPMVRMGRIRLLKGEWNRKFINQFSNFKSGAKHDEWVDCLSQAVRYLLEMELINRDAAILTAFSNPGYGLDPEDAEQRHTLMSNARNDLGISGPGFMEIEITPPGQFGIPGLFGGEMFGIAGSEW